MNREFSEFLMSANLGSAKAARRISAETALKKYAREDGSIDPSNLASAIASASEAVTIDLLRRYTEWLEYDWPE